MATNKPGVVARLFGRTKNSVVTKLYTHALGQPLLVHPQMGEALLGAYLDGAVDAPGMLVERADAGIAQVDQQASVVAVINVSGALVNRPMPDACGPGPTSYEAITNAIDEAAADESVKAIVLRLATPGGMAAGCFDCADRIFDARKKKPVYAMVDDFAYSAGYGLAAACSEIWVTRTGGVGSVGVVFWHMEQSRYNEKIGLTVTPIFSGAHKVDYSQHLPLSKHAREEAQTHVDELRVLFVESVAKYRGVSVETVRATEAATFNGAGAVAAGMADKVGTFRELMAHIGAAPPAVEQTQAPVEDEIDAAANDGDAAASNDDHASADIAADPIGAEDVTAGADAPDAAADAAETVVLKFEVDAGDIAAKVDGLTAKVDAAEKAQAIADADIDPALAMALLKATFTAAEAPERIEHAKKVADICAAANRSELAAGFVKKFVSIDKVRADLVAAAAKADEKVELTTAQPKPEAKPATGTPSSLESIYSRRRAAAAASGK